jgi:hypothetical protein
MTLTFVKTSARPDLAELTGSWRWEAFYKGGETSRAEVLARDAETAASEELMPTVLVLLENHKPVGMVAICLDDLEARPELNPWLAGALCGACVSR